MEAVRKKRPYNLLNDAKSITDNKNILNFLEFSKVIGKLSDKIAYKYYDRLEYFASLSPNFQYPIGEEILTEIERYRALVEATVVNKDKQNISLTIEKFINASKPFIYLSETVNNFITQMFFVLFCYRHLARPTVDMLCILLTQSLEKGPVCIMYA